MYIRSYFPGSNSNIKPAASDNVDAHVLSSESEKSVSLRTCAGSQHDSTGHPAFSAKSASTTSSSHTNITESIETQD